MVFKNYISTAEVV